MPSQSQLHSFTASFLHSIPVHLLCFQARMASKPSFKRTDSIAESMPDALRQSRYQMKRCFQR